jgi:outer membrane immunogenic protein
MKRVAIALLAGVAAVAGLGYSASAADLGVRAAPPPPAPIWTGFYAGVHAGAAWQSTTDWTFGDPNLFLPNQTLGGGVGNALGAVGGLQAGYNWQFAPAWVAGIEGDFSWTSLSDQRTINPASAAGVVFPGASVSMTANADWLSTIRARLGFVGWWNTMFYATGGGAWEEVEYSAQTTLAGAPFAQNFRSNVSHTTTKSGWVAGAGAEWMATTNILLRVEYLYYGLNNGTDQTAQLQPPALPIPFTYNWGRENIQVFRIAGSYKF